MSAILLTILIMAAYFMGGLVYGLAAHYAEGRGERWARYFAEAPVDWQWIQCISIGAILGAVTLFIIVCGICAYIVSLPFKWLRLPKSLNEWGFILRDLGHKHRKK